jgi:hypothetical protein
MTAPQRRRPHDPLRQGQMRRGGLRGATNGVESDAPFNISLSPPVFKLGGVLFIRR